MTTEQRRLAQEASENLHRAVRSGSTESALAALPVVLAEAGSTCAVCLSDMEGQAENRQLPCSHVFHTACLRAWFDRRILCPVCRSDAIPGAACPGDADAQGALPGRLGNPEQPRTSLEARLQQARAEALDFQSPRRSAPGSADHPPASTPPSRTGLAVAHRGARGSPIGHHAAGSSLISREARASRPGLRRRHTTVERLAERPLESHPELRRGHTADGLLGRLDRLMERPPETRPELRSGHTADGLLERLDRLMERLPESRSQPHGAHTADGFMERRLHARRGQSADGSLQAWRGRSGSTAALSALHRGALAPAVDRMAPLREAQGGAPAMRERGATAVRGRWPAAPSHGGSGHSSRSAAGTAAQLRRSSSHAGGTTRGGHARQQ